MATAMLELSSTGIVCIGCFRAGLGVREAEDLSPDLKVSMIILYFNMNATAKIIQVASVTFYRGEKLLKGAGSRFIRVSP